MAANESDEKKQAKAEPTDRISITRHRATIGGRKIAYTATCGTRRATT
jgi:carboxypeptidase C (cathepsin A)